MFGVNAAILFTLVNGAITYYVYTTVKRRYYSPLFDKHLPKDQQVNVHPNFPGFKRNEDVPSFGRIFFGLISFVWIKFILILLLPIMGYFVVKIITRGESLKTIPKSPKYPLIVKINSWMVFIMSIVSGVWFPKKIELKEKAIATYKKYLGSNFDYADQLKTDDYSTVICNHVGWIDILYLSATTNASFVSKDSVRKIPFLGAVAQAMNHVFINRGGTKEEREQVVKVIEERQNLISKKEIKNKLLIFPEGTGTNNTGLIKFKKGPFGGLYPVKPYAILVHDSISKVTDKKKSTDQFSLGAGVMSSLTHVVLSLCYLYFDDFVVVNLPVITPTEFMFQNYSHLGKEKSDIYMEVSRRIMAEVIDFPLLDNETYEKKLEYLCYVKGKKIKST